MIKLIHLIPRLSYIGGIENYLRTIYKQKPPDNFKVTLITFYNDNNTHIRDGLISSGIQIFTLSGSLFERIKYRKLRFILKNFPLTYLKKYFSLKSLLKKLDPDLVIAHGEDMELIGGFLPTEYVKINFIHSIKDFPKNVLFKFILYSYSRKKYDYSFGVCEGISNIFNLEASNFYPFYLGVERPTVKNFLSKPSRIGFLGRIVKEKGIYELIKAFEILQSKEDLILIVGGKGPETTNVERLVSKKELSSSIQILGEIEDKSSFYQMIDIFILPSKFEALPCSILEAMAFGVPVISSKAGCITEIVQNEINGLLLNSITSDEIAGKIIRFLDNELLYKNCREEGIKTAERFSVDSFRSEFFDTIGSLMSIDK